MKTPKHSWKAADAVVTTLKMGADEGAAYDAEININLSEIEPLIAIYPSPG